MAENSLIEFIKDEDSYLQWLHTHPTGFVLNTTADKKSDYLVIHKATCPSISEYGENAQEGGFTERAFIKICAGDQDTIKSWVKQHGHPSSAISYECYCWKDDWW